MNTELEQLKYQIISSIVSLNDLASLSEVKNFLKNTLDTFQTTKKTVSIHVDDELLFWEIVCLAAIDYQKAIKELANQPLSYLFEFEEILAQKLYNLDKKVFFIKCLISR